jgi:hypothetical protein
MASLLAGEGSSQQQFMSADPQAAPEVSPMSVVDAAFGDSDDVGDNSNDIASYIANPEDQEPAPNAQPSTPAQLLMGPSQRNLFSSRARG